MMRARVVQNARSTLLRRREELLVLRQAQLVAEEDLLAVNEPDLSEMSADRGLAIVTDRLEARELDEVGRIDLALQALETGHWGTCHVCAGPIPVARLRATPEANTCADCSEEEARSEDPPETSESRALNPAHEHVREVAPDERALDLEQLGTYALESATEMETTEDQLEPPVDAALRYIPDETFPDRVDWPKDDLE